MGGAKDFQAVLMAGGRGSRMTDLTSVKAKCLLPVGNKPMMYYPLCMLQRMGFKEVIVVVQEDAKVEVQSLPKATGLELNLDIVTIPTCEEDCGTADSLRRVHDKLTAQTIFVLTSDLFTDLSVHQLVDLHRIHRSSVTALFSKASLNLKDIVVPGPKSKPKAERDIIGIDHSSNGQLCYWNAEADLDEDVLSFKRTILKEHPKLKLYTKLTDAHFYIFEKWVVDFIAAEESFSSLKGEVMPYLVRKQFKKIDPDALPQQDDETASPNPKNFEDGNKRVIDDFIRVDEMKRQIQELSSWNDHVGDLKDAYRNRPLRCYAYVMEGGTCLRANNMHTYVELNRQITSLLPSLVPEAANPVLIHPNANIQAKAQVGFECLVGENTNISEKTTIKNCVIGANCQVNEKVRLTNCIIMDNVTVSSLNNISGCIVMDGTETCPNLELKDCIVSRSHEFVKGEKRNHEVLGGEHGKMMEI